MEASKVVQRIQDLMRLAKDQQGLPEGELASDIAHRMMTEHAVSMADIETGPGESDERLVVQDYDLHQRLNWRRFLLSYVCNFCCCKMTYMSGSSVTNIYGYEHDIEVAGYLYEVISKQLEKEATRYYQRELRESVQAGDLTKGAARQLRTSFLSTAVIAVKERLLTIRESESSSEAGIMLAREANVLNFFNKESSATTGSSLSFSYNSAGHEAGMNVDINPAIGSTSKAKAAKVRGLLN